MEQRPDRVPGPAQRHHDSVCPPVRHGYAREVAPPGEMRPQLLFPALLARPPRTVERHHPTVPGALAAAGLARVQATPEGSRAPWSWRHRQRLATGAGAAAALLAALVLAVHRLRQRT